MALRGLQPIRPHPAGAPGRFYMPMLSADRSSWDNTVDAQPNGFPRVTFDWANTNPGYGIHVLELAGRGAGPEISQILANANDIVLAGTGLDSIQFRVVWPGYELKYSRKISIKTKDGPFTRGQLAATIGLHLLRYIDKLENESTAEKNPFQFKPGTGLQLRNVILMSIYNSGPADIYQAELQLEFRH